ncbi:MAG TPA: hypothetical protein VFF06_13850 [Polyangia bacterium]|nr:hypothetical protein [Polyangia bacterium]
MSIHALCQLIDGCDVLSLDVFDTALLRRVGEPVDVFALVAREYRHRRGGALVPFDFAARRIAAERRAREDVWARHQRGDVTLDEIYAALDAPAGWDAAELKSLELAAERALCAQNPYVHAAYRHAQRRGKRIVFVSDMYLPPEFIAGMLRDGGYDQVELFVSSACGGVCKWDGALYRHVAAALGVAPARMLHLGDNPLSDVVMALREGVGALLYPRCAQLAAQAGAEPGGDEPAAAVYRGLVRNRLFAHRGFDALGFWYRFGYRVMGILFAGVGRDAADVAAAFGGDAVVAALLALGESDPRAQRMHEGAREFLADLDGVRAAFPWLAVDARTAAAPMRHVLERPTAEEAHELGELPSALVRPPRWLEAFQDPRRALGGYRRSLWRAGFRARLLRHSLALS